MGNGLIKNGENKIEPLYKRSNSQFKYYKNRIPELVHWLNNFINESVESIEKIENVQIILLIDLMDNNKKINIKHDVILDDIIEKNVTKLNDDLKEIFKLKINGAIESSLTLVNESNNSNRSTERKLENLKTNRSNSIYVESRSPSHSEKEIKEKIKYNYDLFLDCIYKGLTYLPIINYTINNPPDNNDVLFEIINKSVRGNNTTILKYYLNQYNSFSTSNISMLIKSGFEKNSFECLEIIFDKFIKLPFFNELMSGCISDVIDKMQLKLHDFNWYKNNCNYYLLSPNILYCIYKNNKSFFTKLVDSNISNIINILQKTDVNIYNWESAFSENYLTFLLTLNEKVKLSFILDDIQKKDYFKLFFQKNNYVDNISIFMDMFQFNFEFVSNNISNIKSTHLFEFFLYYYKNEILLHFSTILVKNIKHIYSKNFPFDIITIELKNDVNISTCYNYNSVKSPDKTIIIINILKLFVNIK
jgi:hypothetical protein